MSFDPATTRRSADAPEDEALIVDGLERALEQARTKIPDHDKADAVDFPFGRDAVVVPPATGAVKLPEPTVAAPVPFDSSAVMAVLRGAIDRYTNGDGHEQGAWVAEFAQAKDNAPVVGEGPRLAAGYAPDRRRLAAVVVVLFLLVGGIGYSQLGIGGSSEKVNTNTTLTIRGQAVTTAPDVPTSAAQASATLASTSAASASTAQQQTSTTARHASTTAPPATDPATTAPPGTTATTATTKPATTTTTAPATTTTISSSTTTTAQCTPLPCP